MTDIVELLSDIAALIGGNDADDIRKGIDEIERLRAAVKAENEACARIIDPPKSAALTPEASTAKIMRAMLAEAIRARMEAKP